jgi:hypothetical protein
MMISMEFVMNLVAGVAAVLMVLVGGYSIIAIWWDDLS